MKCLLVVVGLSLATACGGGGGFPVDAEPPPPPAKGKFSLTWAVTDTNGQPIPCAKVSANFVNVNLRNPQVSGGDAESFSCSSLMATSLLSFPPGSYDLSYALNGTILGVPSQLATAPTQTGVEIKSNETTAATPITFVVDATGKLDLGINTTVAGGNCAGGAGVTATTITLQHTGAACEPVTFDISAGASRPAGTYTVDCANPPVAQCIDNDQRLTVSTLPSGSYRISIKETAAANDCYVTTQTIIVPPLGNTLTQTLNLTHQTTGC